MSVDLRTCDCLAGFLSPEMVIVRGAGCRFVNGIYIGQERTAVSVAGAHADWMNADC